LRGIKALAERTEGVETSEENRQGKDDPERTYYRRRVNERRDMGQTGTDRDQIMGE
jgi:hypothetical protein